LICDHIHVSSIKHHVSIIAPCATTSCTTLRTVGGVHYNAEYAYLHVATRRTAVRPVATVLATIGGVV
jgi:hypothetical protein